MLFLSLGESYLDCCERILNTLVCIESHQDETYLIVAHQGLLRCILGFLLRVEVSKLGTSWVRSSGVLTLSTGTLFIDGILSCLNFNPSDYVHRWDPCS
jgi:broad specificity phosphatase PhoE